MNFTSNFLLEFYLQNYSIRKIVKKMAQNVTNIKFKVGGKKMYIDVVPKLINIIHLNLVKEF